MTSKKADVMKKTTTIKKMKMTVAQDKMARLQEKEKTHQIQAQLGVTPQERVVTLQMGMTPQAEVNPQVVEVEKVVAVNFRRKFLKGTSILLYLS